jgi:hypothetical protein
MKVIECSNYNKEFPESFPWASIDSILGANIGSEMVNWISHDMRTTDRLLVPGLRLALNILASSVSA